MAHLARSIALLAALAGCSKLLGVNDVTVRDSGQASDGTMADVLPRLIAPLSMSSVTQLKPTLRWKLGTTEGTPAIDLCRDRSCSVLLPGTTLVAGDGSSAVPASALPPGWVYWRVRVVSGARTATSATWQFWVGKSSASTGVDTSNGAILDVNGDGYPDLLVSSFDPNVSRGEVHLYLGSADVGAAWNGASPAGRIDLVSPDVANEGFGWSVASAGDVNGDGYADFVIGTGLTMGSAHLYFGSATPSAAAWNASATPARIDLTSPDSGPDRFGNSVASAGDVNGDGYADFLIGAQAANQTTAGAPHGAAHLYFGSANPSAAAWNEASSPERIDLPGPDGTSSAYGASLAAAGDVNGDGYADFLVGAGNALGAAQGAAHLYLGSASPDPAAWTGTTPIARIDLASPDARAGVFGASVASAGDVNGDGYADFLVGVPGMAGIDGTAHIYVGSAIPGAISWNGASAPNRIDLTNPDGANAGFGFPVTSAGDVNGDGYDDFLVGASATASAGAAHVYFGAATLSAGAWNGASPVKRIDLTGPDGANNAGFGQSMAVAGDVNGDGFADFLIGAFNASAETGAAHLYLGSMAPGVASWNGVAPMRRVDPANPDGAGAGFGWAVASLDQDPGASATIAMLPSRQSPLAAKRRRSLQGPHRVD